MATLWFAEQRINTTTTGSQFSPSIAKLANGGFVIVWADPANAGDIRAQIFSAAGAAVGTELLVATGVETQVDPVVVGLPDGRFRVLWESTGGVAAYAFFNANGSAAPGGSSYSGAALNNLSVAVRPDGVMIDAFELNGDLAFTRIGAGGVFEASALITTTAGAQRHPDIARLNSGQFIVVWTTGATDVRARLLAADGSPAGAEFVVNSTAFTVPESNNPRATVTALANGGFVVTWVSVSPFPGEGFDIRARMFDAGGVPFGADFLVNTTVAGGQFNPEVVALKDGGFLVAWTHNDASTVRGAQFDTTGGRVGPDFLISSGVTAIGAGVPRSISMVLLDDGRVAVTFIGFSGLGDGDNSIRLQIIDPRNGQIDGSGASETIYGGQFDDQIIALAGADTIFALSGQDVVYGGLGADTVFGDVGDDILYGGDDNDVLNAGTGADVVYGELGNDQVFAELGDDLVFGADGADTINGGAGDDAVYGQNGDDVMFGDAGADACFGGFGADTLFLGVGNDVGFGEEGGDTLIGDDGDDVLDGGAGGDVLNGGNGVDNLIGGGEGDILIGGPGGDRLEGGAGGDLYWWQAQTELNDLVVGFNSAEDQLQFTGSQFGGFTAGSNLLNGSTFISSANPNPTGAVPTFLYNNADGSLFFDPDGTGGAARIFVALFQGAPALTAGDFQFV